MSRLFKSRIAWSFLAATTLAAVGFAQQPGRPGARNAPPPGRNPAATPDGQATYADGQLAACLIVDNEGEIALAELAQQKAESEEVKEFARQMQDQHTQYLSQLAPFTSALPAAGTRDGGRTGIRSEQPSRPNANRDGDNPATDNPDARDRDADRGDRATDKDADETDATSANDNAETDTAVKNADRQPAGHAPNARQPGRQVDQRIDIGHGGPSQGIDLVLLKRELGEKCLQSTKRELEGKEGAEFDKCFMVQQAMAHMHMLDTLQVFEGHASPALQQVIQEGIKTTEAHLEHAKKLAKQSEASLVKAD